MGTIFIVMDVNIGLKAVEDGDFEKKKKLEDDNLIFIRVIGLILIQC